MADEFIKGLATFSGASLLWMILAGWYRTPSFDGPQFTAPPPEDPSTYDAMGILIMDGMFWFMILGTIAFWVVIPLYKEFTAAYKERNAN